MNCLVLILCCWLLKKTLVIPSNLANPESAPEYLQNQLYIQLPRNYPIISYISKYQENMLNVGLVCLTVIEKAKMKIKAL